MQVHAQAHTVHLGLIYLFLYLGLFHESIASPLSSIDSPQSLVLPPSMTNFNSTSGYVPNGPPNYHSMTRGLQT